MAILFLDFRAAFYSVIRQGLFANGPPSEAFAHAMYQLGIPPSEVADLLRTAHDDCAVAHISDHVLHLLRDMMQQTYFQVDGLSEVALTTKGTRPGDSVGDAFFNLAMAVILKKVTARIQSSTTATWEGQAALVSDFAMTSEVASFGWFEIAFVDDCAIAMRASSNDQLIALLGTALAAVMRESSQRGLLLNWEHGKTEALFQPCGAGTRAIKEQIARQNNTLEIQHEDETLRLRVVHAYKHLGTWIQTAAKHARDARAKTTSARQAWGPLVRPVFRQRRIDMSTKKLLLGTLVLTRATYNIHVWSWIDPKVITTWAHSLRPLVYPVIRVQLRGLPPFQFSTEVVFGLARLLPPEDQLHAARLRYFQRMIRHCPRILWSLLHHTSSSPQSWLFQLRQSLQWFVDYYGTKCGLSGDSQLLDWVAFVAVDDCWRGRVKKAISSCKRFREENAKAEVWTYAFATELQVQGVPGIGVATSSSSSWTCDECSAAEEQGWLPPKALVPAVRAWGPWLPPHGSVEAETMRLKYLTRWPARDPTPAFEVLSGSWQGDLASQLDEDVPFEKNPDEMCFVYQSSGGREEGSIGQYAAAGLARLHAVLHIRTRCFVHFFSGFRRPHDLQWCTDNHYIIENEQVFCISIDFCLQEKDGDLLGRRPHAWWSRQIASGAIRGIGGGPPCETWSAARLQPDGPPVLRDYEHLFGLPALTQAQWDQVATGTELMMFIADMALLVAYCGGCAFVEHPSFPTWAKAHRPCSIWSTPPLRMMRRRLACVDILTFDQCTVGCRARKPTTLALVRMKPLVRAIHALGDFGRCDHPPGHHPRLSGRDSHGQFKTAIAKVYPPMLNQLVADAVVSHAVSLTESGVPSQLPPDDIMQLNRMNFEAGAADGVLWLAHSFSTLETLKDELLIGVDIPPFAWSALERTTRPKASLKLVSLLR
eukprot:s1838_g10.t1